MDKYERVETKIEDEALQKLLKKSTINTFIAWSLVGFSMALFFNLKYKFIGFSLLMAFSSVSDVIIILILALLFKIESIHLFSVWKYDIKRIQSDRKQRRSSDY